MSEHFTKNDLPFLVEAMEHRAQARAHRRPALRGGPAASNDKVAGAMSVPQPVTVDVNGTMSADDYKACAMVMAVCQNMVQKSITDAAQKAGIPAADALKNMNAWVQAYVDFPFPFFNFKDTQSDTYHKADFQLSVDAAVVESVVNIKGLSGLKDAVIGALKRSEGHLLSYSNSDRKFNYFGVVTGYNETEISSRIVKFQMNMKTTDVKTLCASSAKTNLDTVYDTYQFVADKALMIKMQAKMGDKMVDYMAAKLLEFVQSFYDEQLADYRTKLTSLLRPT